MRGVRRNEPLMRVDRLRVGRLEEGKRCLAIPGRAAKAAPFEVDANRGHARRSAELLRLRDELLTGFEDAAQPFDPSELRQNLGAPLIRRLGRELRAKSLRARVEVVEVPKTTEPVGHGCTVRRVASTPCGSS